MIAYVLTLWSATLSDYREWANAEWPQFTMLDLAVIVWTIAAIVVGFRLLHSWKKRKGFRMVVKDRNDKIHAMWLDIIQDGIDAKIASGHISHKEGRAMFEDAMRKMKLYDLVPKKKIAPIVKESLKRDKAMRAKARAEGTYVEKAPIPGGPPTPVVREKFVQRMGKAAKFWQKDAA